MIVFAVLLAAASLAVERGVQAQSTPPSIEGAWTLDKELSDQPADRQSGSGTDEGRGRGGRGGYGRGGGGFGGGRRGGRGGAPATGADPEEAARMRDAMREIMTAQDHLTIAKTDSMILVTSQDGRTTRLSPDGKKVKDENTKIERKTKWDGDKLVSEIKGLGPGKITETYSVDPETHRLQITVQTEGSRNRPARTLHRVYTADQS